ncbi:hypothetical protein EC957_007469 [Mortierella hygrophila]|uniref:NAD(P)-binding protein n=1 Tax=Mortierella hygrophila TaxID=979708 RepID=A0A9P6K620_9FUNG|nr:hypothetical protein EC957_007469 [Mortierella hygrophila]
MSPYTQAAFWKSLWQRDFFSHDQVPDLTGKVAIVTGANSGLGYATTVSLAAHGARVFLACRNKQRAQNAIERAKAEIKTKFPHAAAPQLDFLELDQGDLTKTKQSAQEFLKLGLPLHILVNNSGIYAGPLGLTADGIESEFGVNHMGIKESQPSRIVILSSYFLEKAAGINYDTIYKAGEIEKPHHQNTWNRYARSKLANAMFAIALSRRVKNEPNLFVNYCHPGLVWTEGNQPTPRQEGERVGLSEKAKGWLIKSISIPVEKGVLTQLYLATSPEIENKRIKGKYYWPVALELEPSSYAKDEKAQEVLWTYSEKLANEKIRAQHKYTSTSPFSQIAYWKSLFQGDGYSYDQIPDLTGKVVIVTGANSGLGYATTVTPSAHGARVVLACRNQARPQEAIERAKEEFKSISNSPTLQLEYLELDMNDMIMTRQAVQGDRLYRSELSNIMFLKAFARRLGNEFRVFVNLRARFYRGPVVENKKITGRQFGPISNEL